jgi:hypothetical protein
MQRLYPFNKRLLWILPFTGRWRETLAQEHVETIRKFRMVLFGFLIASLALAIIEAAYFKLLFVRLHGSS